MTSLPPIRERFRLDKGSCAFTVGYLVTVVLFAYLDVWHSHFFEAGFVYVPYQFSRLVFLGYYFWTLPTAGTWVLNLATRGKFRQVKSLDDFLLASYTGVAMLTLIMIVLGLLMLFYKLTALIITIPLVYGSYGLVANTAWTVRTRGIVGSEDEGGQFDRRWRVVITCLTVVAASLLGFHLFHNGLSVDLDRVIKDSVDHYFPSYLEVIERHGLRHDVYHHQFYYTKGAGLHFLAILLTDPHSFQLANFCMQILGVLTLYRVVQLTAGGQVWPLLAVIFYLGSPQIFSARYHKVHVAMGSMLVFTWYLQVLWVRRGPPVGALVVLGLVGAATVILSPTSLVFLGPSLVFMFVCLAWLGRGFSVPGYLSVLAAVTAAFGFVILCNYHFTGLAEITPVSPWWQWRNDATMRDGLGYSFWTGVRITDPAQHQIDQTWIRHFFLHGKWTGWLHDPIMGPPSVYYVFLCLAVLSLFKSTIRNDQGMRLLFLTFAPALAISIIIEVFNPQDSVARYLLFMLFFRVLMYVCILMIICRLIGGLKQEMGVLAALIGPVIFLGCLGAAEYYRTAQASIGVAFRFAAGQSAYVDVYRSTYSVDHGVRCREIVGAGTPVLCVDRNDAVLANFPDRQFIYYIPRCLPDLERIFFGPPHLARTLLEDKHAIRFFLLNLPPTDHFLQHQERLALLGYSPLFQTAALSENFEVAATIGEHAFLLTWRKTPASELEPAMQRFLAMWQVRKAHGQANGVYFYRWHHNWNKLSLFDVDTRMWDQHPPVSPLAFFTSWQQQADKFLAADLFLDANFQPRRQVVVDVDPGFPSQPPTDHLPVTMLSEKNDRVEAELDAPTNGIVLWQEMLLPSWYVYVDGQPAQMLRANGKYMAVAVPAGKHRVVFQYVDRFVLLFWAAAVGSVLFLLVPSFWVYLRRKSSRSQGTIEAATVAPTVPPEVPKPVDVTAAPKSS